MAEENAAGAAAGVVQKTADGTAAGVHLAAAQGGKAELNMRCLCCGCLVLRSSALLAGGRPLAEALLACDDPAACELPPDLPSFRRPQAAGGALPPRPTHVWHVPTQMHFENVGVSRAAGAPSGGAGEALRYLSCADCDVGPIGVRTAGGRFFVYADRVRTCVAGAADDVRPPRPA